VCLLILLVLSACAQKDEFEKIVIMGEEMPSNPFGYKPSPENFESKLTEKLDYTIKPSSINQNDSIISFSLKTTVIRVYKVEDDFVLIDATIMDSAIKLQKDIAVGISRDYFNTVFPDAKQYKGKLISICDESEMTTLYFTFNKSDKLEKIDFVNNELEIE
jgi:hypothetical protein